MLASLCLLSSPLESYKDRRRLSESVTKTDVVCAIPFMLCREKNTQRCRRNRKESIQKYGHQRIVYTATAFPCKVRGSRQCAVEVSTVLVGTTQHYFVPISLLFLLACCVVGFSYRDVAAIALAEASMGDYKLKSSEGYEVVFRERSVEGLIWHTRCPRVAAKFALRVFC